MAKLNTYLVTLSEMIAHTVDIRATTPNAAERVAIRYWKEDGAEAFTDVTLGRAAAGTTKLVQP